VDGILLIALLRTAKILKYRKKAREEKRRKLKVMRIFACTTLENYNDNLYTADIPGDKM
jgi:adenine-specific DNA methylase